MKIKVSFGIDNSTSISTLESGSTIGQALELARPVLGFGANVRPLISGVAQSLDTAVRDGDHITVETAANTKG